MDNKTFDFSSKKKDFLPKKDQILPKIGIFGQFGPGHAGLFVALLVGRLVVVARGLFLARHLFTLYKLSIIFLVLVIPVLVWKEELVHLDHFFSAVLEAVSWRCKSPFPHQFTYHPASLLSPWCWPSDEGNKTLTPTMMAMVVHHGMIKHLVKARKLGGELHPHGVQGLLGTAELAINSTS